MKNYCVGFLLFTVSAVFAQNIEGIGDFKIGMSSNEFLEIPVIKDKNIRDKSKSYESPKSGEVLRINANTRFDEYMSGGIKDSGANLSRIHSSDIEKYEFIMALGISDIINKDEYKLSATFYEGVLVSIRVGNGNSEFKKILIQKYGNPIIEDKSKIETCQNGFGAKTDHINGSINSYWGRGEAVEANFTTGNFSCGKYPYSSYEVYNPTKKSKVDAIQLEGFKRLRQEELKNKAGASKI